MSLAEIEKQVLELSEEERRQFAAWFYRNEGKILPPPLDDEEGGDVSDACGSARRSGAGPAGVA